MKYGTFSAEIASESEKAGFIFANNEAYDLNLVLTHHGDEEETVSFGYTVRDSKGAVKVRKENIQAELPPSGSREEALELDSLTEYGRFTLEIRIYSQRGEKLADAACPFSRALAEGAPIHVTGATTHYAVNKGGDPSINLTLLSQAGVGWIREEVLWKNCETVKGEIAMPSSYKNVLRVAEEKGLNMMTILNYGNPALYGSDPGDPEWIEAYANYCRAVVKASKGIVAAYEIWNEWSGGLGWGGTIHSVEAYVDVLIAAADAVHEADPEAIVIAGVAHSGRADDGILGGADWIIGMIDCIERKGRLDILDAVSFHPYTFPASPESGRLERQTEQINTYLKEKGLGHVTVWYTEIGWPTHTGETGVTEELSAAYLARLYTWALAHSGSVEHIAWYDVQNDGMDAGQMEDNFGMLYSWLEEEAVPYGAKQSYVAACAWASILSGAAYVSEADMGEGVYAYLFEKDGQDLIVAWCDGKSRILSFDLGDASITSSDMFGNASTLSGAAAIALSDTPVYLQGDLDGIGFEEYGNFALEAGAIEAWPGERVAVVINRSGAMEDMEGNYALALPDGWTADNLAFEAGSSQDTIYITLNAISESGRQTICITPQAGESDVNQMALTVSVKENWQIAPVPSEREDGSDWMIRVTVSNENSEFPLEGELSLSAPELGESFTPVEVNLAAGERETCFFDVAEDVFNDVTDNTIYYADVTLATEGGVRKVSRPIRILTAKETETPITIDGVLDEEWGKAMVFATDQWVAKGAAYPGNTLEGRTGFDADYFYLIVTVHDATHFNVKTGASIFTGDSIQLAIDWDRQYGINPDAVNEIGIALNSEDGEVYAWKWTTSTESGTLSDAAKFAVIRDDGAATTTYEAAIPWTDLIPAGAGVTAEDLDEIGFSLVANNADVNGDGAHTGRNGYLEYMGGIGSGKHPEKFADLALIHARKSIPTSIQRR